MPLKVEEPIIKPEKRTIVVSDIHGNLKAFKRLLHKVRLSTDDVLILLGDIVEKGEESLNLLRFIMKLSNVYTVLPVCGNCDAIALEVYHTEKNRELSTYIRKREHTLLGEMCREANIQITDSTDMLSIKKKLQLLYEKELNFIKKMPHVLIVNQYVFAHAAIYPGAFDQQKPSQVMKADAYMNMGFTFSDYHVVGHWPTVLYSKNIPDCNPRIDKQHKIISIDGGNILKRDGQINALIIPNTAKDEVSFMSVDLLPKAKVLNTQEEGEESFYISWLHNKVDILKREKEFSFCCQSNTNHKLWIPNSYLYQERDGSWHTEDITDYQIPLTMSDIVSVAEKTSRGYLVKKNGICGWYYGMLEPIKDPDEYEFQI